jgi:Carbamoyltransferase N-terminus
VHILGISAFYHDSAACLLSDGKIVAAAQEERFTRKKGDATFPAHAVEYCLRSAGITVRDLTYVGFYDKPLLKFERILETYLGVAPKGFRSFLKAGPLWIKEKLFTDRQLRETLGYDGEILYAEHHESHAASAFFPSPQHHQRVVGLDAGAEEVVAASHHRHHAAGWSAVNLHAGFGAGPFHLLDLLTRLKMTKSPKVLLVLTLAAMLVACGGSKKDGAPARGGGRATVSRATDDIPTSNRTGLYLDRYRFGDSTDADGIVVKETSVIPPGSTAAMSFYVRNAPTGTQVRIVWNDITKNAAIGEEVKPVGDKGLLTFKQANPSPEGSYRVNMYFKLPQSKGWDNLGTHDFRVGRKS